MTKKVETLTSSLLKEGSRFIVKSEPKDGTITPYSVGFLSCYEPGTQNNDMVRAHAVIVRKGKGGMERIDKNYLFCPVYNLPEIKDLLLANKRKYYVFLERDSEDKYDVRSLSDLHFLGWAAAKVDMLLRVTGWFSKGAKIPIKTKLLNNIYALNAGIFKNDPAGCKATYANEQRRVEIVQEIRRKESEAVRALLSYHKSVVDTHLQAISWLAISMQNDSEKPISDEVVTETIGRATAEQAAVETLIKEHQTKI